MDPGAINWLRIGVLGMMWGSSFMAVSVAVTSVGPLSVAAGRLTIGAILLFLLTRARGISLPSPSGNDGRKVWAAAFGFGFFSMAFPFFLLGWGQKYVTSGFAGVTMSTVPLLVLPMAHFLVPGDRITVLKSSGLAFGFAGVWVLIGPGALESLETEIEPIARLACFSAASCYAIGSIITRLAPRIDQIAFATTATILAAIMILPVALWIEGWPQNASTSALWAIIYLGALPTAGANLLLVAVIRSAGPSFLSMVNYQVPLWSVIFGVLFLNEVLPPAIFLALALILGGAALSQFHSLRRVLFGGTSN